MKKLLKKVFILFPLMAVAVIVLFGLHWGWKYYFLSDFPSRSAYETMERRVDDALAFAHQHKMNEHYALFVDYSIPSGKPRMYVWDFEKKKIVYCAYVMHGPGGGSTDKVA
ncbi:MAG: murein L,D-transpeptidase catalytic domain family protein [Bacteroidales bacterium]|nr:murein L,D-transpeptidase catalytic domain family protein [Bacteroidales bacterium]